MYTISFYFSISELPKILEIINILWENFAKIFGNKFDWVAYTDVEKFLKLADNEHNEIYVVPMINDNWPMNAVNFWKDDFAISLLMNATIMEELGFWSSGWNIFLEKMKTFAKDSINQIPNILAITFWDWDEPAEDWYNDLTKEIILEFSQFGYILENWKLILIDGKDNYLRNC